MNLYCKTVWDGFPVLRTSLPTQLMLEVQKAESQQSTCSVICTKKCWLHLAISKSGLAFIWKYSNRSYSWQKKVRKSFSNVLKLPTPNIHISSNYGFWISCDLLWLIGWLLMCGAMLILSQLPYKGLVRGTGWKCTLIAASLGKYSQALCKLWSQEMNGKQLEWARTANYVPRNYNLSNLIQILKFVF